MPGDTATSCQDQLTPALLTALPYQAHLSPLPHPTHEATRGKSE